MNRRHLLGSIGTLGVGVAVGFAAQEDDERITDLEETVEALDEWVTALEEDAGGSSSEEEDSEATGDEEPSGGDGDWVTVEGEGKTVTDKFELEAGRYRVHATVQVTGSIDTFSVVIYDPNGGESYIFIELIEESGEWTAEAAYEAGNQGEYYADVDTGSAWKMEFEPF